MKQVGAMIESGFAGLSIQSAIHGNIQIRVFIPQYSNTRHDTRNKFLSTKSGENSHKQHFVHQIDKLDMALQAIVYEQNEQFDGKEFIDSAKSAVHDPSLQTLLKKILARD